MLPLYWERGWFTLLESNLFQNVFLCCLFVCSCVPLFVFSYVLPCVLLCSQVCWLPRCGRRRGGDQKEVWAPGSEKPFLYNEDSTVLLLLLLLQLSPNSPALLQRSSWLYLKTVVFSNALYTVHSAQCNGVASTVHWETTCLDAGWIVHST